MATAESPPPAYPERWEVDVALSDGGTVHIRPVRPEDAERVRAFHARQSRESIYFRYFSPMPKLSQREIDRLTKVDYRDRMAFIAVLDDDIVGMASYDVWRESNAAEVAFIVDDAHQGRGLATVLLEYLIVAARENGLEALTAQVLPSNRRMLAVFHQAGFEVDSSFAEGIIEVRLGIEPTEEAAAAVEDRARRAEARSVERLLFPESVAVIGAGRERGGVGHEVFRNLVARGFDGPVYPVNSESPHVGSVRSYASVLDIVDEVDLAIIAVPADNVLEVVDECARKRVRGLVVISAGLDELGGEPGSGERLVVERALRGGIRVIGPESMGVINSAPGTRLHATFASVEVLAGKVGFLTQSGTLGIAALEHAHRMGVGISAFVDIGSRVDVSGNDLLQFWDGDDRTQVVLLYLESFGNPRKFTRIARRMARHKPIVALKSGRTLPPEREFVDGGLAAVWPTDATVGALLSQSGIIRVNTPDELFNMARVLVNQPVPAGRRVAIVSNGRGASVLTADACVGEGLELADLSPATVDALREVLPDSVGVGNPLDLGWAGSPDEYDRALRLLLGDDGVDAAIVVYAPPIRERRADVARAVGSVAGELPDKPILATFLGSEGGDPAVGGGATIPVFAFPSEAARMLGLVARYGEWLAEPEGTVPEPDDLDIDGVRDLVAGVLEASPDGCWLDRDASARLLTLAGLPVAPHRLVGDVDEAVQAARSIGFPVVLKATGVERYHRGEGGGVALDLHDPDSLRAAYRRMVDQLGTAMDMAVVQQQAPAGADILVGAHQHPSFGAVVSVGIGGVMAAANPDLPVQVLPLSDTDAHRLVASSPVASLLEVEAPGHAATRACEAFLLRLGALLEHVPELADLLLNPVIVGAGGVWTTDAWVRVAPYRWDPSPAVRRLS